METRLQRLEERRPGPTLLLKRIDERLQRVEIKVEQGRNTQIEQVALKRHATNLPSSRAMATATPSAASHWRRRGSTRSHLPSAVGAGGERFS